MAPRNPSIIGLANDMPFIINASDSVFLSQSIVFSGLHWLSHCGSLSLSLINNGFAMLCYAKIRIVRVCVVEARGRLDEPSVDGQSNSPSFNGLESRGYIQSRSSFLVQ